MTREDITIKQMKVLLTFFMIGDMMWYLPSFTTNAVEQDAWISTIIGLLLGLGVAVLLYRFWTAFGGRTLVGIHRYVMGKYVGGMLTILFIVHLLSNASAQVRVIGDFMTTQMLTETPIRVVLVLFGAVVMIAVRTGLTVIARTGQLFILVFCFLFVMLFFLLIPEANMTSLKPIFSHSFPELARGAYYVMIFPYFQLICLLMLLPLVQRETADNEGEPLGTGLLKALLIGGSTALIVVMLSITVLGTYMTEHQMYSTYTMAKKISIGNFLQRLEAILVISYVMSTYFKCTITIYAMCRALTELLALKDYKVIVFPVYVLLYGGSYYVADNVVFFRGIGAAWSFWECTNMTLFIGLVYLVYLVRKKMGWLPAGIQSKP
jgi:spore germination protein KB